MHNLLYVQLSQITLATNPVNCTSIQCVRQPMLFHFI